MLPRLLIMADTGASSHGAARLLDSGGQRDIEFGSASDLLKELDPESKHILAVSGAKHDDPLTEHLVSELKHRIDTVWLAADLTYLLNLRQPVGMDELETFADNVQLKLADIEDDLLAQICLLVEESGAQERLGLFNAELHSRHDVLNIPGAGNVIIDAFYPKRGSSGTPARQDVPSDILERVFEARENISHAFERYEDRPEQREMVSHVEDALENSHPLIIEAGTGVGKSLAYLLPLAVHSAAKGKLCVVSTNTINLQQQLIDQDIPRLQGILDSLDLRITLLKGREHYLCVKRLEGTWLMATRAAAQRREAFLTGTPALMYAIRLLIDHTSEVRGDLDDTPAPKGLRLNDQVRIMGGIDCGFATCLGERCDHSNNCHFFNQRNEAMLSNLVVTNHALVFSLHDPSMSDTDNIVTRAHAIVFDEAHNLENAITSQNTLEVHHEYLVDLANDLVSLMHQEGCRRRLELSVDQVAEGWRDALTRVKQAVMELPDWVRLGVEIRDQVNKLLGQAADKGHLSHDYSTQITPPTATPNQRQIMDLLKKLAQRLLAVVNKYAGVVTDMSWMFTDEESDMYIDDPMFQIDLKRLGIELRECQYALSHWDPENSQVITWFNSDLSSLEPRWDYKTAPLKVGDIFQSLVNDKECVILCSATLTVAGSFDYIQSSLGFEPATIGRSNWVKLASPFDYGKQSLLLVATDLKPPTGYTRDEYLDQLESVVAGVERIFPRGILVLFNSYRDLNHIADRLATQLDSDRLLVQGLSGSRSEIADRFRREGNKVLFATRSFWEGFDVAGDALSCVVLAKLPFANFKDPIHAGRQRAIDADGGDSFSNYSVPLAVMQLKQGFGRLIRSNRDYGCVFLLDSRVATAKYGGIFLDSLPGPHTVKGEYQHCLDAAEEFMEKWENGDA